MALTGALRGCALVAFLLGVLSVVSCTSTNTEEPATALEFPVSVPQKRANFEAVVVFLPLNERVKPVWTSLRDELSAEFDVIPVPISNSSTQEDFAHAFAEHAPKCVVLVDNKTTRLYARYQSSLPSQSFPPAVILLTSYADIYNRVRNSTGIAYEVPLVISASRLRNYIAKPLDRVGVVHRSVFRDYVKTQAALARVEEIEVVAAEVPNDASPREVAKALSGLAEGGMDALWILNDNALLQADHIQAGWLWMLSKAPTPTIVGIPGLVSPDVRFGTFAVVPDLGALGVQSATLIYDLADNGWRIAEGQGIEQPLSVQTVLDVERARRYFNFREEMLDEINPAAPEGGS